jgi:hypothetical protein
MERNDEIKLAVHLFKEERDFHAGSGWSEIV